MLLEKGASLAFGHASPDTELDAVVQRVGATLRDHRAVTTDHRGFALGGPPDEQFIGVRLTTPSLRNPSNTSFCLRTGHNGLGSCVHGGRASRGLD